MSDRETLKHLKEVIEELREEGLTYEELGAKAGVAATTINRINRGVTDPRPKTITKILRAFEKYIHSGEEGIIRGFESPFTVLTKQDHLEEQYQQLEEEMEDFILDKSIPLTYKREFLRLLSTVNHTLRRLIEES